MRWNLSVAALAASWGLVSVIVAGVDLDAAALAFYRLAIAAVAVGVGLALAGRAALVRIPRPRGRVLLVGVALAAHWLLFFETIKRSSVAFAILVVYTGPIMLALVAPLFLPERRSRVVFAALPLAAAGIAMLALADGEATNSGVVALLAGLASAAAFVALIVLTKQALERVRVLTLQFWNCAVGALVLAPFLLGVERVTPHRDEVGYLLVLGLVFTVATGLLYVWLLRRVRAQAVGVLGYIEPVSASVLAWLILGQPITWAVAAGGALVVAAGVLVVVFEPTEAPPPEPPTPLRPLPSRASQ